MSTSMSIIDRMEEVEKRINNQEEMLGKGLLQPFANANSGSRKIMSGTHREHELALCNPEVPLVQTGYENEFGYNSSSFITADSDYLVIAKIPKFSFNKEHHYFMIMLDINTQELSYIERISYKHITETYGYMLNNNMIDRSNVGEVIPKNSVIQKSTSYDEFDNRMDGVNLITDYFNCEFTQEDGIILSISGAKKLRSPLLKKVPIVINDNDIPLNLYGNNDIYKIMPNIGEFSTGILCGMRREKNEEILFSQSYARLQDFMMSDDKYTTKGKVVDVNIYCNNVEKLNSSYYYDQMKMYYDDKMRFNTELVLLINSFNGKYKLSYELQKLYATAKKIIDGGQFIKDRTFSNIYMEVMVLEESEIEEGDKLADRYGGKGVVSIILPDELMPQLPNGDVVEMICNSSSCVNRLNPGQLIETSITSIGGKILDYVKMQVLDDTDYINLYKQYLSAFSPTLGNYISDKIDLMNEDDISQFLSSIISDSGIAVSLKPISESIDIDKLSNVYDAFPWMVPTKNAVPITDSNGNIRYVPTRRPITSGKKYVMRLKQYAEEKFSATSLSSTNIRNENSRNKANKSYRSLYPKTPIKFGEMETGHMFHLGPEQVIINLMLYSASPHGRRLAEELLTGDPYSIDIKLDMDSTNRGVEILNAYLKTMGLKLFFTKVYKKRKAPILRTAVEFLYGNKKQFRKPIFFGNKNEAFDPEYIVKLKEREYNNGLRRAIIKYPVEFLYGHKSDDKG